MAISQVESSERLHDLSGGIMQKAVSPYSILFYSKTFAFFFANSFDFVCYSVSFFLASYRGALCNLNAPFFQVPWESQKACGERRHCTGLAGDMAANSASPPNTTQRANAQANPIIQALGNVFKTNTGGELDHEQIAKLLHSNIGRLGQLAQQGQLTTQQITQVKAIFIFAQWNTHADYVCGPKLKEFADRHRPGVTLPPQGTAQVIIVSLLFDSLNQNIFVSSLKSVSKPLELLARLLDLTFRQTLLHTRSVKLSAQRIQVQCNGRVLSKEGQPWVVVFLEGGC